MSFRGMIRRRGLRADVYRPVTADGAGGLVDVTWPQEPVSSNIAGFPEVIADELAKRIFGHERVVDVRLLVEPNADIREDDGLAVRSGPYAGQRFRVTGAVPTVQGRSAHLELALQRTTEVFG